MTEREVAEFIVQRWLADHAPQAIMLQLLCLGVPLKKAQILLVVRRWIEETTENRKEKQG